VKLDLQVQVGCGEENVHARVLCGFQSLRGRQDVVFPCASQGGNRDVPDFPGDCHYGIEVALGRNWKAGLDNIDA
jgi:hypothetical protein